MKLVVSEEDVRLQGWQGMGNLTYQGVAKHKAPVSKFECWVFEDTDTNDQYNNYLHCI